VGAARAWRGLRTVVAVAAAAVAALTAAAPAAALAGAAPAVIGAAPAVVGAAPAAGGAVAACSGVAVVVDFGSLGGGARTGCFAGDPSSGLQALSGAGFSYSFVPRQPGLVCQINAKPDQCNGAPATAYWSYWHGRPGGSWTYSSTGAGGYNPAPGGVEGWSFGAGQAPGIAPPAAAPAPPPPAPPPPPAQSTTQRAPQQGAPGGPAPTTAARPGQPSATAGQPPAETPAGSTTPTATSQDGGAASSSVGPAAGSGAQGSPEPAAAADRSPGRTLGLIAGIVLVAVLGGLTFWTARRRAKAAE